MTENTITDRERLRDELQEIQTQGYAVGKEEGIVGINDVAVPIATDAARHVGSISIYGPKNRLQGDYLTEELPKRLKQVKDVVELNVTYSQLSARSLDGFSANENQ
jgi:DNA-binding IclR family transcriptional regulator